jgi:ABC-type transport system involved in cytochrome bd biosynthesis fused ATPase/permease subunit
MFVAQESHIFHTTLRENLLMAKPDATEQELQHVLALVSLTNLVESLEQGLDTQLGEHGALLSGGERRRLSIARALLTSPSVLLLDEPTVGVDGALARQMLSSIRALLPESTFVVATHDAWLLAMAEQNIRLPAGKRAAW